MFQIFSKTYTGINNKFFIFKLSLKSIFSFKLVQFEVKKEQEWLNYEHIQADIFDHILASTKYFDLEIFEFPTGNDVNFNK